MRTLIFALALSGAAVALQSAPAAAQTVQYAPWCAEVPEGSTTECAFTSERQCLEAISGEGGYCEVNPGFTEASPYAMGRPVRHRKHN
jgi:uncharacterized protein DUF3551